MNPLEDPLTYGQWLELVKKVLRDEFDVHSTGMSIMEVLDDAYAAGGADFARGLMAAKAAGADVNIVTLRPDDGD